MLSDDLDRDPTAIVQDRVESQADACQAWNAPDDVVVSTAKPPVPSLGVPKRLCRDLNPSDVIDSLLLYRSNMSVNALTGARK